MTNSKDLTRRNFISKSLMISAGAFLTGCISNSTDRNPETVNKLLPVQDNGDPTQSSLKSKYNEAPILAKKVATGELPPVDERLPKFPFIREVASIGIYGGTLYDDAESQGAVSF
jgi:hypothetical protein